MNNPLKVDIGIKNKMDGTNVILLSEIKKPVDPDKEEEESTSYSQLIENGVY